MHSLLDTTLWSGCVAILGVCGELLGIEFEYLVGGKCDEVPLRPAGCA